MLPRWARIIRRRGRTLCASVTPARRTPSINAMNSCDSTLSLIPRCRVGAGNSDMRELADSVAPWDWSGAEVVLLGGPGQEISRTLSRKGQRLITTELRAMYDDLVQQPLPERLVELAAQLES